MKKKANKRWYIEMKVMPLRILTRFDAVRLNICHMHFYLYTTKCDKKRKREIHLSKRSTIQLDEKSHYERQAQVCSERTYTSEVDSSCPIRVGISGVAGGAVHCDIPVNIHRRRRRRR